MRYTFPSLFTTLLSLPILIEAAILPNQFINPGIFDPLRGITIHAPGPVVLPDSTLTPTQASNPPPSEDSTPLLDSRAGRLDWNPLWGIGPVILPAPAAATIAQSQTSD